MHFLIAILALAALSALAYPVAQFNAPALAGRDAAEPILQRSANGNAVRLTGRHDYGGHSYDADEEETDGDDIPDKRSIYAYVDTLDM